LRDGRISPFGDSPNGETRVNGAAAADRADRSAESGPAPDPAAYLAVRHGGAQGPPVCDQDMTYYAGGGMPYGRPGFAGACGEAGNGDRLAGWDGDAVLRYITP